MTTKALIIPAAGMGSRMNKKIPKPFLRLSGGTILEHTIRNFISLAGLTQIIVATSAEYLETAQHILDDTLPDEISTDCLVGGNERQDSIRNALGEVGDVDLILVHDAVRPFVKEVHIASCCQAASQVGAAVLGIPAKDTIKRVDKQQFIQKTPNRKLLWHTQTPQVFKKELILEAYKNASDDNFTGTDDASLVERLNHQIKMIEGDQSNFKITYPLDLKLAQLLINKEQL